VDKYHDNWHEIKSYYLDTTLDYSKNDFPLTSWAAIGATNPTNPARGYLTKTAIDPHHHQLISTSTSDADITFSFGWGMITRSISLARGVTLIE
jgi:hypothetical protein